MKLGDVNKEDFMELIPLDLEARNSFGKLNKIRNSGYIPGIVYGEGMEPEPVQIKESVFLSRNKVNLAETRGWSKITVSMHQTISIQAPLSGLFTHKCQGSHPDLSIDWTSGILKGNTD